MDKRGNAPKRRREHSIQYKIDILEEIKRSTTADVCRKYNINDSMVRRWKRNRAVIEASVGIRNVRCPGGGRKPVIEALEDMVFDYVAEKRSDNNYVTKKEIKDYALAIAQMEENDSFVASDGWLKRFMDKYGLSLGPSSGEMKAQDRDVIRRCVSYIKYMKQLDWSQYDPSDVVAMNETAVHLGYRRSKTISLKAGIGVSNGDLQFKGSIIVVILAIRRNGSKVDPCLILNGNKDRVVHKEGVTILYSTKAWSTPEVTNMWLDTVFPNATTDSKRGLVIWNSSPSHRKCALKEKPTRRKIDVIALPAGTACYLQSLDFCVGKTFRETMRKEIGKYSEAGCLVKPEMLLRPSIEDIVGWVRRSWGAVSDFEVDSALRAAFWHPQTNVTETYVYRNGRVGGFFREQMRCGSDFELKTLNTDLEPEIDVSAIF